MITKNLLISGGIAVCGFIALLVFDEIRGAKKKARMLKELPSILPRQGQKGKRARVVHKELWDRGVRLSRSRFDHLMARLEEEDVVASQKQSDQEGRFLSYCLLAKEEPG